MMHRQDGIFARAFILANRLFGVGVILAGTYLVAIFLASVLWRSRSIEETWVVGVSGVICVIVGIVYVRAPLTRPTLEPGAIDATKSQRHS
jgi:formate-dependent nitrite reductase membrane component NrfD